MAKRLEKIFEECLERINRGESIESCLQRYPEVAADLGLMLRTYLNVKWRSSMVQPDQNFRERTRLQLLYTQRNVPQRNPAARQKQKTGFSFGRIWAPALTAVLVFLLISTAGTAAAATGAMPDQPLYPVKLATEQVQLALTFTDTDKAILNSQLAEKRSEEIEVMASQGKTEEVIQTTSLMLKSLEDAEVAVYKAASKSSGTVQTVTPYTPPPFTPPPPPPATATQPAVAVTENATEMATSTDNTTDNTTAAAALSATSTAATQNATGPKETVGPEKQAGSDNVTKTGKTTGTKNIEADNVKSSVTASLDKNLDFLESALIKAPESAKEAIQKAIDIAKSKRDSINAAKFNRHTSDNDNENTDRNRSNRNNTTTPPATDNKTATDNRTSNVTPATTVAPTTKPAATTITPTPTPTSTTTTKPTSDRPWSKTNTR